MQLVALLPGLLAAWVAMRRGAAAAFLDVYLPVLLLCPDYFRWIAPGLPDPTMSEAAILPIAGWYLLRERDHWRWTSLDGLVFGFAFLKALTEYNAKSYAEAQNLMFDVLGTVVFPYMLAKALIAPKGLSVAFAKRFVVLSAAAGIISLYEFRMGRNPFRMFFDRFFPGQGSWVTTFRYGFARAAGPYGHAILAGIVFMAGYRLQRWLEWSGQWRGRAWFLPMTRARFFTLALLGSIVISLARGPQMGAAAGGLLLLVARSPSRKAIAASVLGVLLVVSIPSIAAFREYVSVGRAGAKTVSQETAAYRAELFEKYSSLALERAWLGWGQGAWPKIPGLESTDNHYLLLALNHGVVALALFLAIVVVTSVRLIAFAARQPPRDSRGMLAVSLAAVFIGYFLALATVYQGMQTVQVFFLITGWSDALLSRSFALPHVAQPRRQPMPAYSFRRVLA